MKIFNELKELIAEAEVDMVKFYEKKNMAAGVRARKSMMEVRKLAQEVRLDIQDIKNKGV